MNAEAKIDPLLSGFYTYGDVKRFLRLHNTNKIRGWVQGWSQSKKGPIIARDFKGGSTVSFLDLMEIRFIDHFRRVGVSSQTLRVAAEQARDTWQLSHPFARELKYVTDRKAIFERAANETKDKTTIDMVSGQHQMWDVIEETIAEDVIFDPSNSLAMIWRPSNDYPDIFLNPRVAFGKPAIGKAGVPTSTIYDLWKAEKSIRRVAHWFEIPESQAKQAIQFEVSMAG